MILDSEDEDIRRSVLWIYSNMVTSPSKDFNEKIINAFFQEAPLQKISECAVDSSSNKIRDEAIWVLCNIVNCGTNIQAKTLFEMTTYEKEGLDENLLLLALIKKIKICHDEQLC